MVDHKFPDEGRHRRVAAWHSAKRLITSDFNIDETTLEAHIPGIKIFS
jgi:hypothetical protein